MRSPRPWHRSTPWRAWLLATLLLVAQALGLAHGIAHAPGPGQGGSVAGQAPTQAPTEVRAQVQAQYHGHGHGHGEAQAPLPWADGHEADTPECRLIDQLAHADGLCDATWADAPLPKARAAGVAAPAAAPGAGSASAYLARAPPLA